MDITSDPMESLSLSLSLSFSRTVELRCALNRCVT